MAAVDAGYAAWLKSQARYVTAHITGSETAYPAGTVDSEIISPIGAKADAEAEVVRQAQFLAGPIARDTHVMVGQLSHLVGTLVSITGDRLGYEDGRLCFVVEAREEQDRATTILSVLTRLDQ